MVVCRTIGVVREEEDDKKGWLVVSKKGQVVSVSKLIDNSDNREEVYQLFSSEDNLGQFANCVGYDSLDQLADSLALVLGISRSSKNPFDIEKNDQ